MDEFAAMWASVQQAVYIAYGPILLWVLGLLLAAVVALGAWNLALALFRKYFG